MSLHLDLADILHEMAAAIDAFSTEEKTGLVPSLANEDAEMKAGLCFVEDATRIRDADVREIFTDLAKRILNQVDMAERIACRLDSNPAFVEFKRPLAVTLNRVRRLRPMADGKIKNPAIRAGVERFAILKEQVFEQLQDLADEIEIAMGQAAGAVPVENGPLYELRPGGWLAREGYEPVRIRSDIELNLLRLLQKQNPLSVAATHSKAPTAPWRGTYKAECFPNVQRTVNRMSSLRLGQIGLEAKISRRDGSIRIYTTDLVKI